LLNKHDTPLEKSFDILNYCILTIFALVTVLPFVYIIAGSFATEAELTERSFFLFPRDPSLNAYHYIFSSSTIFRSIGVSIFITVVGTLTNLAFTLSMAYSLSRKDLLGRNVVMNLVIFSMLFSGGLIPSYLIVKELGLLNNYMAVILPGAISAFNLIIIKNFFQQLPAGLEESARIDGCTELGIWWHVMIPAIKPALVTLGIFVFIGSWSDFLWPLLVLDRPEYYTLPLGVANLAGTFSLDWRLVAAGSIISIVPVLGLFLLLQKYIVPTETAAGVKG